MPIKIKIYDYILVWEQGVEKKLQVQDEWIKNRFVKSNDLLDINKEWAREVIKYYGIRIKVATRFCDSM
jgi:predicted double-glycine peptidase